MIDLCLASQSPRRAELLQQIGVNFKKLLVNVPEQLQPNETPEGYVLRLAKLKSAAGVMQSDGVVPVLGADTVVVLENTILEKPESTSHARAMLQSLSGKQHHVFTAVAVGNNQSMVSCTVKTEVKFRQLMESEITRYIDTGEPMDKAGGYGIQGFGGIFVESISGSYTNVVGLPLFETAQLLQDFSVPLWEAS